MEIANIAYRFVAPFKILTCRNFIIQFVFLFCTIQLLNAYCSWRADLCYDIFLIVNYKFSFKFITDYGC